MRRVTSRAKKRRAFRKKSSRQRKRTKSCHRLHNDDENSRHRFPRSQKTQGRPQHPRQRRIKNKPRLAKSVVRPLRPPRKKDAPFPLPPNLHPPTPVKSQIF